MRQQVSPAVVIVVIVLVVIVLAAIWYFMYGRPPADTGEEGLEEEPVVEDEYQDDEGAMDEPIEDSALPVERTRWVA